jgi:hypothetical protein
MDSSDQSFLEKYLADNGAIAGTVHLSNAIERAVALAQYQQITAADVPEKIRSCRRSHVIVASQIRTSS